MGKGDWARTPDKTKYDKGYEEAFGTREPNLNSVPWDERCSKCNKLICICEDPLKEVLEGSSCPYCLLVYCFCTCEDPIEKGAVDGE